MLAGNKGGGRGGGQSVVDPLCKSIVYTHTWLSFFIGLFRFLCYWGKTLRVKPPDPILDHHTGITHWINVLNHSNLPQRLHEWKIKLMSIHNNTILNRSHTSISIIQNFISDNSLGGGLDILMLWQGIVVYRAAFPLPPQLKHWYFIQ